MINPSRRQLNTSQGKDWQNRRKDLRSALQTCLDRFLDEGKLYCKNSEMLMRSKKIKVDDTGTKLLEDFYLQTIEFLAKTDRNLLAKMLGRFSFIDSTTLNKRVTPRQERSIAESFSSDQDDLSLKRKRHNLSHYQSKKLYTSKSRSRFIS